MLGLNVLSIYKIILDLIHRAIRKIYGLAQKSVHKSLEDTKDNIRKSIDEAKNQIPQYTTVVSNIADNDNDNCSFIKNS
jgi:hypothetical protein